MNKGTKESTITDSYLYSDFELQDCTFFIYDNNECIFYEYITPSLKLHCLTKQIIFNDNFITLKADAIQTLLLSNYDIVKRHRKDELVDKISLKGIVPNDKLEYLIINLGVNEKTKQEVVIDIPKDAFSNILLTPHNLSIRTHVPNLAKLANGVDAFDIDHFTTMSKLDHYGRNLTDLMFIKQCDFEQIKVWFTSNRYGLHNIRSLKIFSNDDSTTQDILKVAKLQLKWLKLLSIVTDNAVSAETEKLAEEILKIYPFLEIELNSKHKLLKDFKKRDLHGVYQ